MESKTVSVLMATYNNENTVKNAVNSILSQTYKNIEILILDDCSTDKTYQVLQNEFKKNKIVKIFRNERNIGLTKSLNKLINKSNGYFIARQDADDLSFPDRILKQIVFLNKYNLEVCTTRSVNIQTKKPLPGISFYLPIKLIIRFKNPFIHGSLLITKNLLNKINQYDEEYYYSQDYKLFCDLIKNGYKIGVLRSILYMSNMKDNISSLNKKEQKYFAKKAQLSLRRGIDL